MPRVYWPDLALIDGEFRSGAGILVGDDGRIEGILSQSDLGHRNPNIDPNIDQVRLHGRAILPGFVNAHSHTFQRLIRGRAEHRGVSGDDFWSWRNAMYAAALRVDADDVYHVARMTFLEMVLTGTTTVGEFHYLHRAPDGKAYSDPNLLSKQVLAAATSVGLRIGLLRCAYSRAGFGLNPNPGQVRFYESTAEYLENTALLADSMPASDKAWLGVAPHSIRALPLESLEEIIPWANDRKLPVHLHIAEQPAEIAACLAEYGAPPVELMARNGLLSNTTTLVHSIHISSTEMESIAQSGATICACPTTERNLGDGIIRADRAARLGIPFALGSDSQAQIDPLEDARQLEYHLRLADKKRVILDAIAGKDLSARVFEYATLGGARALGCDAGELAEGRLADFFSIDLDDPSIVQAEFSRDTSNEVASDLLPIVVFSLARTAIRDVIVGGQRIVEQGKHPLQQEIIRNYQAVYNKVWRI